MSKQHVMSQPTLPRKGEGSAFMSVGAKDGDASRAGRGLWLATGDGEGHVVTGVCCRGRWLLQAQGAGPGRVRCLPMPAHQYRQVTAYPYHIRTLVLFKGLVRFGCASELILLAK